MIVDPLMAFLNVKDSNNDQQIRQALYPLTDFAAETTALCWWCDI